MRLATRLDRVRSHVRAAAAWTPIAGALIAASTAQNAAGQNAAGQNAQRQAHAGTTISNQAGVQALAGSAPVSALSNVAAFVVAERLDVTLAADGPAATTVDGVAAIAADLTNAGNGDEAFALVASVTDGLTVRGIAVDVNGDGRYDAAVDHLLDGGVTPILPAGGRLHLLVLVGGGTMADASVTLVARAVTGSGAPGTIFPGRGDGGADAVVGPTGAEARLTVTLAAAPPPVLTKSQSVVAPDGGDRAVRGAVVTYTLQASFAAAVRGVRIDDPIPAGASYVAGSLSLDGVPLTDAADGDAGGCDGAAVAVSLGDVPARAAHTVRFQTRLQ